MCAVFGNQIPARRADELETHVSEINKTVQVNIGDLKVADEN